MITFDPTAVVVVDHSLDHWQDAIDDRIDMEDKIAKEKADMAMAGYQTYSPTRNEFAKLYDSNGRIIRKARRRRRPTPLRYFKGL